MKAPVNTTLAVGAMAVLMIVSLESKHQDELVAVHQDGVAVGYKLGQADIAETAMKRVTDKACHAWWFGGDTQRVAKSIQKVSIK
jgi:ATP-dependent Clp protease adapter protein ClpS